MMAYLVFEFYTADLISLMASPPKLSTIKTFEELLNGRIEPDSDDEYEEESLCGNWNDNTTRKRHQMRRARQVEKDYSDDEDE